MCVAFAGSAAAQSVPTTGDDPVAEARFKLGVVGANPRIAMRDIGVDTNVFNSATNKQRDFTFTTTPGVELFMRTGKGLLSIDGGLDLVYFNQFDTERSINSNVRGQYEFRFNRMRPYASVSSINTRQRPGYEIDIRARHYETDVHAGTDVRIASKSTIRVDLRHLDYSFDGDAVFGGRPLNQQLNRKLKSIDLGWRQRLTALTTWVTRISRETERFSYEPLRNADSKSQTQEK